MRAEYTISEIEVYNNFFEFDIILDYDRFENYNSIDTITVRDVMPFRDKKGIHARTICMENEPVYKYKNVIQMAVRNSYDCIERFETLAERYSKKQFTEKQFLNLVKSWAKKHAKLIACDKIRPTHEKSKIVYCVPPVA